MCRQAYFSPQVPQPFRDQHGGGGCRALVNARPIPAVYNRQKTSAAPTPPVATQAPPTYSTPINNPYQVYVNSLVTTTPILSHSLLPRWRVSALLLGHQLFKQPWLLYYTPLLSHNLLLACGPPCGVVCRRVCGIPYLAPSITRTIHDV